jgi:hypothetical protein
VPRVCLFFDGKNHMKDLRMAAEDRWIDHSLLAKWAVEAVGGDDMVAAHYYTGVPSQSDDTSGRTTLSDLLHELEGRPGFFVHRFPRQTSTWQCSSCGHHEPFTREKLVDTALVADVVLMAARDLFDVCVLFSGDYDIAPAMDAVHSLGKKAWLATFGQVGMNRRLRESAWGVLDLAGNIDRFAHPSIRERPTSAVTAPQLSDAEVLRELQRAQDHFQGGGGFVGTQYFLHRWRGQGIPEDGEARRAAVERLMQAGLIEMYESGGRSALRVVGRIDLQGAGASGGSAAEVDVEAALGVEDAPTTPAVVVSKPGGSDDAG